ALLLLTIDESRAGYEINCCDLGQRYLCRSVCALYSDRDVANCAWSVPIARRKSHNNRKMLIAIRYIQFTGGIATNGGANRRINIAGGEAIAAGALTININLYSRLAE